jgi:hypothetical protein
MLKNTGKHFPRPRQSSEKAIHNPSFFFELGNEQACW